MPSFFQILRQQHCQERLGDTAIAACFRRTQRGKSFAAIIDIDPSGAQFTGTPSKLAGKDTKFTLAVGLIKVNPSARITGLTDGHVERMSSDLMVKLANTNRFRVMERQEVDHPIRAPEDRPVFGELRITVFEYHIQL